MTSNDDEFKYYFELSELESFGIIPSTERPDSPRTKDVQADDRPAEPEPTVVASANQTPTPDTVEPRKSSNAQSSTPKSLEGDSTLTNKYDKSLDDVGATEHTQGPVSTDRNWRDNSSVSPNSLTVSHSSTSLNHESGLALSKSQPLNSGPRRLEAAVPLESSSFKPLDDRRSSDAAFFETMMSVHALGQFEFCNRSGVYAVENGDESEVDEQKPRLDYLPNFDLERIEERLSQLIRHLLLAILLNAILVLAMVVAVWLQSRAVFYPALVAALLSFLLITQLLQMILILGYRRRSALLAEKQEPDPRIDRITPVNWWSLLKSGFELGNYERQFRHPELPLEGSPWRILERGSLRIPVIKSGANKLGDAKHAVYPKHEVRLAAYAVLLEATEHIEVPYGLVFPADSHLGLAIPITGALRQAVTQRLERALDIVKRSQSGEFALRPPQDRKRCANCQLGQPTSITASEVANSKRANIPLLVLEDKLLYTYHCPCGDRFGSAPPHQRIIQLGLKASVE